MSGLTTEDTEDTELDTPDTDIGILKLARVFERERNKALKELLKVKSSYSEFREKITLNYNNLLKNSLEVKSELDQAIKELKEWQTLRLYGADPEHIHDYIKRLRYEEVGNE
jgi:hypothetical protein